ncbi:hypothetical protein VCR20J5_1280151 [Vibrio crassostreae]|nr:hypothetical protein VCR20J5_1280151 [Vibrio crassostreae]CDT71637.1 hypothetical protein VCR9J2_920105 [Vibrio crassostreae]
MARLSGWKWPITKAIEEGRIATPARPDSVRDTMVIHSIDGAYSFDIEAITPKTSPHIKSRRQPIYRPRIPLVSINDAPIRG